MRIFIPCLLAALFFMAHTPARGAEESQKNPDGDLLAIYDKGVTATAKTSPVVEKLFDHLHACVPSMGQGQVTEAEGKAEAERAEQHKAMTDSVSILRKADGSIKEEVNAQLKRAPPIDTNKVDVCQGDSDTFKKMLSDAKEKSRAAAARKIDSIASSLREKQKFILNKIKVQMQKNSHDKPEDLAGLNKAKNWVFTPSSKAACDRAIQMVSGEATNKDLANYEKYLLDLDKGISAWREQKGAAVAAELDKKIDQQMAPKLVDRNKCGSQVAQEPENTKKQAPNAGASKADKPAATAGTKTDKAAVIGASAKPAEAPAVAYAAKPEAKTDGLAPPRGENTSADTAQRFLNDTAPKSEAARQDLTVTQNSGEASDIKGLKPLTADDVNATSTYQSNSKVELKPAEAMPGVDTLDDSNSKSMKAAYQQNAEFTKRDLDFNSSKDTKYIQNALNQVRAQNGLLAISADGVFGSRTTVALDQVMQNPAQKAAFLAALKQQMNGGRSTASK